MRFVCFGDDLNNYEGLSVRGQERKNRSMNKVFKVILNRSTQTWTVVSELSKSRGKASRSDNRPTVLALTLGAAAAMLGGGVGGHSGRKSGYSFR